MGKQGYGGFSFPFRFDGRGGVATSSTSSYDFTHIKEGIMQVLGTRLGERVNEPEFGSLVHRVQFANTGDTRAMSLLEAYVREAITNWDKRVEVLDVFIAEYSGSEYKGFEVTLNVRVNKFLQELNIQFGYSYEGEIIKYE